MTNKDYSELTTQVEPTARRLYEAANRREWSDMEKHAMHLADLAFELRVIAMKAQTHSGNGYLIEV